MCGDGLDGGVFICMDTSGGDAYCGHPKSLWISLIIFVLRIPILVLIGYFLTPVIGDLRDIQDSALTLGDLLLTHRCISVLISFMVLYFICRVCTVMFSIPQAILAVVTNAIALAIFGSIFDSILTSVRRYNDALLDLSMTSAPSPTLHNLQPKDYGAIRKRLFAALYTLLAQFAAEVVILVLVSLWRKSKEEHILFPTRDTVTEQPRRHLGTDDIEFAMVTPPSRQTQSLHGQRYDWYHRDDVLPSPPLRRYEERGSFRRQHS